MGPAPRPLADRFWEKVAKTDTCWEWTAGRASLVYGLFWVSDGINKTLYAHRVSWKLATGKDPGDACVCHRCDNRLCVRPDHLFLGSYKENMIDATNKGRMARGERQSQAKLTEASVRAIRSLRRTGMSYAGIGRHFGVSDTLIANVIKGIDWRHVP